MIPSDHFVRFYNEVFKTLDAKGRRCLVEYWRELGRLQKKELAARFRKGGVAAARDYWKRIIFEENCRAEIVERGDGFEFRMSACPSLGKVLDNDAGPFELYCDHCMGWVEPVMKDSGLYAVMDMVSRCEPRCVFFVTDDKAAAVKAAKRARLPSTPYKPGTLPPPEETRAEQLRRALVKMEKTDKEKLCNVAAMAVFLLPGVVAVVGLIFENALPNEWQGGKGPAWTRWLSNVTLVAAILAFVAPVLAGIFKHKRALQIGALLCILILGIFGALCMGGVER